LNCWHIFPKKDGKITPIICQNQDHVKKIYHGIQKKPKYPSNLTHSRGCAALKR